MGDGQRDQRGERSKKLTATDEVWHELVLHGIGGRTIAEAKTRISDHELRAWIAYRQLRGSLNTVRAIEYGAALVAFATNRASGGTAVLEDFLVERPPVDDSAELEKAMREWK